MRARIPRQFGAIRNEPGNLCLRKTAWWGSEDSNFQPNDYQPLSLSEQRAGLGDFVRTVAKLGRCFYEYAKNPLPRMDAFA